MVLAVCKKGQNLQSQDMQALGGVHWEANLLDDAASKDGAGAMYVWMVSNSRVMVRCIRHLARLPHLHTSCTRDYICSTHNQNVVHLSAHLAFDIVRHN